MWGSLTLTPTTCNISVLKDLRQGCNARQKSTQTIVGFVQSVQRYMGSNTANSMMKFCALSDYLD